MRHLFFLIKSLAFILLYCILPLVASNAAGNNQLRTVVLSDHPVPGVEGDASFINLRISSINRDGKVAFLSFLDGADVHSENELGIWSEGSHRGLELIARQGGLAPGTSATFRGFNRPILSHSGHTIFRALLNWDLPSVDHSNDSGIWRSMEQSSTTLLVREGEPVPGTSETFEYFSTPDANAFGLISVHGFAGDFGIWRETNGGDFQVVSREGEPAPGIGGDAQFESIDSGFSMSTDGSLAFRASLLGDDITSYNNRGIWRTNKVGGLELVVQSGDTVPGFTSEVRFFDFSQPAQNVVGQTVFSASLTEGVALGIWSANVNGEIRPVVRTDEQAPGTGPGITFRNFRTGYQLNDLGHLAYRGILQGNGINESNDTGIWVEKEIGQTEIFVREGQPAPGIPGAYFDTVDGFGLFNSGQLAVYARLEGEAIDNSNNLGIWAQDSLGNLSLVVRSGDQINVSDEPSLQDLRTVQSLRWGFNDIGEVAFQANFTDGSEGIFVSSIVSTRASSDFDFDGDVDGNDFLAWQRDMRLGSLSDWAAEYGQNSSNLVTVPEPAMTNLLLAANMILMANLRWRVEST